MEQGTVRWFNPEKGFGFITPDNGAKDIFVHYTEIIGTGFRSLEENQRVQYESAASTAGEQAYNVTGL